MPVAILIITMPTETDPSSNGGLAAEHLVWFSPAFPVGSFAFSHGLEWAISSGEVATADGLRLWLGDLVQSGSLGNDAVLIAATQRAATAGAGPDIIAANELALALASSAERRLETVSQGNAFRAIVATAWGGDFTAVAGSDVAYPIAVGVAAAGRGFGITPTVAAYLQSAIGNLVSIAVRLGRVTQPEGQHVIASLLPLVGLVAERAAIATLDDLGGAVFAADIAAIRHETLDGRLFRS